MTDRQDSRGPDRAGREDGDREGLDKQLAFQLGPVLEDGESLIWAGRPRQGLRFTPSDIVMVPFSVFWLFFTLLWIGLTVVSFAENGPAFLYWTFLMLGGLFLIIGLYMLAGRFLYDLLNRRRIVYCLTNRRALVVSGFVGRDVHGIDLTPGLEIRMGERPDGSGWLAFGAAGGLSLEGVPTVPAWTAMGPVLFDGIRDVRRVRTLARRLVDPD